MTGCVAWKQGNWLILWPNSERLISNIVIMMVDDLGFSSLTSVLIFRTNTWQTCPELPSQLSYSVCYLLLCRRIFTWVVLILTISTRCRFQNIYISRNKNHNHLGRCKTADRSWSDWVAFTIGWLISLQKNILHSFFTRKSTLATVSRQIDDFGTNKNLVLCSYNLINNAYRMKEEPPFLILQGTEWRGVRR